MKQILDYLIEKGQTWVLEQRDLHRPRAMALDQNVRSAFEPFFGADTLPD